MRLRAISAGAGMPRDHFTGIVHSVFRRACNVELDRDRMLVLLAAELGNAPHGVRLATPAGFAFDRHLIPGQPVGCRAGVLRVGRGALSVDLRDARPWTVDLRTLPLDMAHGSVAHAWRVARRALAQSREDGARLLETAALARLDGLTAATRALDVRGAARAVRGLVGTGTGLTPSGDDLAVGFIAGLWCTIGTSRRRLAFTASLAAAMRSAAGATNAVSRAYLQHAADGHVSEPLAVLGAAIATAAPDTDVAGAVDRAAGIGASSGREGVRGLLRALEAWAGRPASRAAARSSRLRPAGRRVRAREVACG